MRLACLAALVAACFTAERDDDATDPLIGGPGFGSGDADTDTDADGDTDGDTDIDTDTDTWWRGTRNVEVSMEGYGTVCRMWWTTEGWPSADLCPDCEFAFDVRANWEGDDYGTCDGAMWMTEVGLGFVPYYFSDGGSYPHALMLRHGGEWTLMFHAEYENGLVRYYGEWEGYYGEDYGILYAWQGEAAVLWP